VSAPILPFGCIRNSLQEIRPNSKRYLRLLWAPSKNSDTGSYELCGNRHSTASLSRTYESIWAQCKSSIESRRRRCLSSPATPSFLSLSAIHPHAAGAASSDGRRAGRPARTRGWHGTGWGGRHAGRPAWAGGAHDETGGAHAGRLEREAGTALAGTRPDAQE
jgi:hypothetical protein